MITFVKRTYQKAKTQPEENAPNQSARFIHFEHRLDEPGKPLRSRVHISRQDWQDMGEPTEVIVTVQPFDVIDPPPGL